MNQLKIIREVSVKEYEKILFERPISKQQSRSVAIIVGKHALLKNINDIYEIISALHHFPIVIAEYQSNNKSSVPAEMFLTSNPKSSDMTYYNTDDVIQRVNDCGYVVLGVDFELNSALQLFIEKLIISRIGPILFSDEVMAIAKLSPHIFLKRHDDVYVFNKTNLLKFTRIFKINHEFNDELGVLHILNIMQKLSIHLNANIVVVEPIQVLAVSYKQTGHGFIANIDNPNKINLKNYYMAILVSLLSDGGGIKMDFLNRCATTCYLLRNSIKPDKNMLSSLKNLI